MAEGVAAGAQIVTAQTDQALLGLVQSLLGVVGDGQGRLAGKQELQSGLPGAVRRQACMQSAASALPALHCLSSQQCCCCHLEDSRARLRSSILPGVVAGEPGRRTGTSFAQRRGAMWSHLSKCSLSDACTAAVSKQADMFPCPAWPLEADLCTRQSCRQVWPCQAQSDGVLRQEAAQLQQAGPVRCLLVSPCTARCLGAACGCNVFTSKGIVLTYQVYAERLRRRAAHVTQAHSLDGLQDGERHIHQQGCKAAGQVRHRDW